MVEELLLLDVFDVALQNRAQSTIVIRMRILDPINLLGELVQTVIILFEMRANLLHRVKFLVLLQEHESVLRVELRLFWVLHVQMLVIIRQKEHEVKEHFEVVARPSTNARETIGALVLVAYVDHAFDFVLLQELPVLKSMKGVMYEKSTTCNDVPLKQLLENSFFFNSYRSST